MTQFPKLLVLSLLLLGLTGVVSCGGGDDEGACDDVICLEGTSCIIQDSGPACVPD